jgi:hypothetical protein
MTSPPVMIPPQDAAGLLACHAVAVTDPGRGRAAIEAVRRLCETAARCGVMVSPAAVLDALDGLDALVITGAEAGPRLATWNLGDAIALTRDPHAEATWSPHPYHRSHCLLIVARHPHRAVHFNVPAPGPHPQGQP